MIYYSLRSGDVAAALQAAEQAGQGLAEVARWLEEVRSSPGGRISPHSENLVKLSYRRAVRSSTDPFKRAVHCVLGACDPSDEHAVPIGGAIEKNFPAPAGPIGPIGPTAVPRWKVALPPAPPPFRYTLSSAMGGIKSCEEGGVGAGRYGGGCWCFGGRTGA